MTEKKLLENIALYIHIPFCISKCKYCDFFSQTSLSNSLLDAYIDSLCNEIKFRKKLNNIESLETIYIGGGTPSLLSEKHIENLFKFLKDEFPFSDKMEISIEVNPDDVREDLLHAYRKNGINRISCGIQSMNDKALAYACRRADLKENRRALNLLQKEWGGNFSLDLICGLPCENESSFLSGLQEIISYNPDHISMYSLTIEEGTPFGKMFENGLLDYDFEFADEMWLKGRRLLEENSYNQYEVSNFSRKGRESKHNLFYWNHKDYLGCGSGASGSLYDDDGLGNRWTNSRDIKKYISFWKDLEKSDINISLPQETEKISLDDSIFEFFMMGLRKLSGVKQSEFEKCFHKAIPEKIINSFKKWKSMGLCQIEEIRGDYVYSLGKKGILFLNKFLEEIY